MRDIAHGQRGQDTIEWAGLLLLVSAIIAALLLSGVPASIARGVECNVTKVLGGGSSSSCAASPAASDPNAPWNSPDPVSRATWGQYVSLGDSYSAGEGLGNYQPGSHVEKSQCQISTPFGCAYHKDPKVIDNCDRSASAYNGTVSGKYDFKGAKQTWACSGSITKDIYDGPGDPHCSAGKASGAHGEGCQAGRVNASTSLVTMSIGGNDAGFSSDLINCYIHDVKKGGTGGMAGGGSCSFERSTIDQKIAGIRSNLIPALQALRARAPHARIILITYPRLFPEPPTADSGCIGPICLTPADQEFFNQEADKLDSAVCADAQAAGVGAECVNASNAFAGCTLGEANSCVQAPHLQIHDKGLTSLPLGSNPGAFHPTARGQQILGNLVNQEIQNPPPGGGPH